MNRTRLLLAVAVGVLVTAGGCGSANVHPVKGTVKFDGKPMKGGGAISFVPTGRQAGKTAGGDIAEDGTYTLMTHKPGDGSMVGEFRVVIHQVTEREPDNTNDGERVGKSVVLVATADRIPAIYGDTYNSPLTAKVEAKDNVIDFDLKRGAGNADRNPGDAFGPLRRRDDVARNDREPFGPFRVTRRGSIR